MEQQETLYAIALTRMTGFNFQTALHLYNALGSARSIFEHRNNIRDIIPDCSDRLVTALAHWSVPLARAEQEMAFIDKHHITALCPSDKCYPRRLADCPDAPIVLYYMGTADLNQRHIISIVGTRHCTAYGQDLVRYFVTDLKQQCPQVLIVSGLAYGIDICAHRQALACGYETVGVLAHGLDDLYPSRHRDTAREMIHQGGLITEYISETKSDKLNFVKRNRIVAGMADATILVESAAHGGGLITARIAQDYNRQVMAFPGPVFAPYSEGCNNLIRDNAAQLISSAADFIDAMGWQTDIQRQHARSRGIERDLFPELTSEERKIVNALGKSGDLQLNHLAVTTGISAGQLIAILFGLEMKGVIRPLAGGTYHLLA